MGSGGGGSSGKSSWPDYMQDKHTTWLNELDVIIPAANPYTGVVAYDPATPISNLSTALTNYKAYNLSIGYSLTAFKSLWSGWLTTVTADLTAAITAELDTYGVPEFESGMRDINAVQVSSFTLGKSMLYARVGLEAGKLALMNTNQAVDLTMRYSERLHEQFIAELENAKTVIISYKEFRDMQIEIDAEEAKWVFFNYREAGALLGAIGGAGAMQSGGKPSAAASALGGAMTGAATGAAVSGGNPYGAAAGAVIGGIGGYLSAR
jgi:hypothetical protein